jgi:putative glutamine amidotransferase
MHAHRNPAPTGAELLAAVEVQAASRPLVIGVSCYARGGRPPAFSLPCAYVDAVRAAGATPVMLPPGEARPERLLDLVDGFILAGGGDVAPKVYGGRPHETVREVSTERDEFEFALAGAALSRADLPLLCICRGLQVLNVVCGGTLHTHLPERFGEQVAHRSPRRLPTYHGVRIAADSGLAEILGVTDARVCSWHHQAIDAAGSGLRAVAWAADGVIEGVEHATHPWCCGVQWHPEMQFTELPAQRLFTALVRAAAEKVSTRSRCTT